MLIHRYSVSFFTPKNKFRIFLKLKLKSESTYRRRKEEMYLWWWALKMHRIIKYCGVILPWYRDSGKTLEKRVINKYIKKWWYNFPNNHTDYSDYHHQNSYHIIYRKILWNTQLIHSEWCKIRSWELNRIDPKITRKSRRQQAGLWLKLSYNRCCSGGGAISRGWKENQIRRKCRQDQGEMDGLKVRWMMWWIGRLWWWVVADWDMSWTVREAGSVSGSGTAVVADVPS